MRARILLETHTVAGIPVLLLLPEGARRLPPLQAAIVGQLTGQPPQWMRTLALRP